MPLTLGLVQLPLPIQTVPAYQLGDMDYPDQLKEQRQHGRTWRVEKLAQHMQQSL